MRAEASCNTLINRKAFHRELDYWKTTYRRALDCLRRARNNLHAGLSGMPTPHRLAVTFHRHSTSFFLRDTRPWDSFGLSLFVDVFCSAACRLDTTNRG